MEAIGGWPVGRAAAGVIDQAGERQTAGDTGSFRWASVTKLATALATLVAHEEGAVDLADDVLPGITVCHLLAHAGGLAPEPPPRRLAPPGTRRIYSNAGYELVAEHVAAGSAMGFGEYLRMAVLEPLGMAGTILEGSPASGLVGPLADALALAGELMRPTLVSEATAAEATHVAFPGLDGVLPGFGIQRPCDWGLGMELKSRKTPHWTGDLNSPKTFGHFGRSGSFLWVDPEASLACAALSDRDFGEWAMSAWPALSDAVLRSCRGRGEPIRSPG